jgi:hypothetical protein
MKLRPARLALQALALAGVAGLLVLLVWKLTHDPGGGVAAQLSQGKRPQAPDFTLPRLDGQGSVDLAAIKYSRTYAGRIAFVGVNTLDAGTDARKYVQRYALTYTIVRENGRKVLNAWGGLPIPRIFFIDRNGKVIGEMQAEEDLPRFLKKLALDA